MLNKNALIVAASLGAIPLTAVLIAAVIRRARHGSLQRSTLLRQIGSESSSPTATGHTGITQNQPQKERPHSHLQSESLPQSSEILEKTTTSATSAATISNNVTDTEKDILMHVVLAVTVPSPIEPSFSNAESANIASNSETSIEAEISISDEAKKAGESLKDLIIGAIKDAKNSAKVTGKRLKEETVDIAATTGSKDIESSRSDVNTLVGLYETMMTEIRKENYDGQIKLFQSYKDLLQAQIKVVNARRVMVSKLKPGA